MTPEYIRQLVVSIDPKADRYESEYRAGRAYTVWYDRGPLDCVGDGEYLGGIRFTIVRLTKTENDAVAAALFSALDALDNVAFDYRPDFDPQTGYIMHIFECEGI